jgi:O-antigen ligase
MAYLGALMVMILSGRLHDAVVYGSLPVAKVFLIVGAVLFATSGGSAILAAGLRTLPARSFVLLTLMILASVPFSVLRGRSLGAAITWITASVPIAIIVHTSIRSVTDLERTLRSLVWMVIISGLMILAGRGVVMDTPEGPRISLVESYDPNDFAVVIAASSAACLWLLREKVVLWRLVGLIGLVLGGLLVVKTGSRGGALAFGGLLMGTVLFLPKSLSKTTRVSILVALVMGIVLSPSNFVERLSSLKDVGNDYNVTAASGRIEVWKRGIGYVASSPLVGVGVGAFPIADGRWAVEHGYKAGFKWSAAHSLAIETAAELGIPGFIFTMCCLLPIVFTWRKLVSENDGSEQQLRLRRAIEAIALITLTFLVGTLFVNGLFSPLLLVLTALSASAHLLLARLEGERSQSPQSGRLIGKNVAGKFSPSHRYRGSSR